MDQVKIGFHIKKARLQQKRTQQEIADFCGFTKSHLSKIEKGKVMPSIGVLAKIADSLGIKISFLLDEDNHKDITHDVHATVVNQLIKTSKGYSMYPFASAQEDKAMQPFYFETHSNEHKLHKTTHEGEEFLYILEGEMILKIGDQEYHLKEGDGIYFNGSMEHQTIPLSETVKVLDIIS
ncbi:MAG: XRE family transcriptional regulator [Spirochaetae bacterium HGW-Spirochaetae-4]|jgi:transcriptional regulator with XRE-family HTH domain|nr:MAG: XRE family transcriptional regulator [Spirochaetae bacterium HGW-Spirochaetae-8]PKL22236.1 MAG: XRE family transcriptional regulator [Spirochaetae bacterium HGW-Spirochaetae-4]HCS37588.1 XRE family transcriptional regulator [Sphaerochaeta sp.]